MADDVIDVRRERIFFWDNMKGLLILLVVFAHYLYSFQSDETIRAVVSSIYLFHMPAFIFTTGFLSKSLRCRSGRGLVKLLIIFLVFNGLFMLAFDRGSPDAVRPYYVMWYILAMVFWRLTVERLSKLRHIMPVLLFAALVCGLWDTITNELALSRFIAFYPFFMAGYLLDKSTFSEGLQRRGVRERLFGAAALLAAGILAGVSYAFFDFKKEDLLMSHYCAPVDVLKRIAVFAISTLVIFAMCRLVPNKRIPFLSKIGRNTLVIYLCHRPITIVFSRFCPAMSATPLLLVSLAATVFTTMLFGSEWVDRLLSGFFETATDLFYGRKDLPRWKSCVVKSTCVVLAILVVLLPLFSHLRKFL